MRQTGGRVAGNRTLALLRCMFGLAREWEWLRGENPCDRAVNPERDRRGFLTRMR